MKILAIAPNMNDATAFYRVIMPLLNLQKTGKITFELTDNPSFTEILACDVVFLQRPCIDIHLGIAEKCKLYNKPLVIDYDDNLFEVPEHNPAHHLYSRENIKSNMSKCVGLADHVIVSTESLKQALSHLNSKITVVNNALDLSLMPPREVSWNKRRTDIMWRGTNTHQADIASVAPQIAKLSHKYPNWRWLFMGVDYRILESFMAPKTYGYAGVFPEINVFLRKLQQLSAPIHIVPLDDSKFNQSKSNLAWLEATWAGSAVVAPDLLEWRQDCIQIYNGPNGLLNTISYLISNPDNIKKLNEDSWELIQAEYLIEHVNKLRYTIFNEILQK